MLKHLFKGTKWDVPCERCAKPLSACQCPPPPEPRPATREAAPAEQRVSVRLEKRPGGKRVTVVAGLAAKDRETLLPALKSLCGAGGTDKDERLEIQGEHRERLAAELA